MLKALVLKELRETAWIALLALLADLALVANCAGYNVLPFWPARNVSQEIPFLDLNSLTSFLPSFCIISVALAITLGLRQTVSESRRGTWLFLLHRPVSMGRVLAAKLAVGGGLYLVCGLITILSYAAWAAMPGKHPSPFLWWMTVPSWEAWGLIGIIYLAAFLAGLRPARWFGTRLLPLAAGGPILFAVLLAFVFSWTLLGIGVYFLVAGCLVGLIHFTARTRDFS
jgi:ABC-type transport system involved in multi-copper enzyme maturation permease subunit